MISNVHTFSQFLAIPVIIEMVPIFSEIEIEIEIEDAMENPLCFACRNNTCCFHASDSVALNGEMLTV